MDISVTKPIQEFIERQLLKGYSDPGEVARQALLRWMEEEDFDGDPPHLQEKINAALAGSFRPYEPENYDAINASIHESAGRRK